MASCRSCARRSPWSRAVRYGDRRVTEDHDRFEQLFERNHRQVLAYCLRRSPTHADAEDATAEAFTVAWRRRDAAPQAELALPWLYAIARRTLANQRRGNDRRARLAARIEPPSSDAHLGGAAGPGFDALQRLRPDDQELLRLVAWEDLRYDEIAEVLGISANAVAIRLHRARVRFEQELRATSSPHEVKEIERRRTSTRLKGRMIGLLRRESSE